MQINIVSDPKETNTKDSWYPRLVLKTQKKIADPIATIWIGQQARFTYEEAEV